MLGKIAWNYHSNGEITLNRFCQLQRPAWTERKPLILTKAEAAPQAEGWLPMRGAQGGGGVHGLAMRIVLMQTSLGSLHPYRTKQHTYAGMQ